MSRTVGAVMKAMIYISRAPIYYEVESPLPRRRTSAMRRINGPHRVGYGRPVSGDKRPVYDIHRPFTGIWQLRAISGRSVESLELLQSTLNRHTRGSKSVIQIGLDDRRRHGSDLVRPSDHSMTS